VERGNHGQRLPRPSAEIKRDTEEYKNLSLLIETIMKFLRANVSLISLYRQVYLTFPIDEGSNSRGI
jgi:hypothetical protein